MRKRRGSLRREISRKAVARPWTREKRSASKEELFEEKMDMDIMVEENDHGNNINAIENIDLETIGDLFKLCKKECGS